MSTLQKKKGFTLIEILITTVLIFLVFSLVYATFFSISKNTAELQDRMRSSEIVFRFLKGFSEEIKSAICSYEDADFCYDGRELSFITKDPTNLYPVKITYFTEISGDGRETLFRNQHNLLDGYSFVYPVLRDIDAVNFLFYDGEVWTSQLDLQKITAVAIELDYDGEKIFFPVNLYTEKNDTEKKK